MSWKLAEDRKVKGKEMRMAVMDAVNALMDVRDDILFFEADLAGASGSGRVQKAHPDKYVQCGISEANMVGMAAGASAYGFKPYIHTFGPFATRRVFDQIYLSGAYAGNTINIYGSDPGFTAGPNGGTHTTWEDVALMRTIPGSVVVDAADATQLDWVTKAFASLGPGIHYVRANRKNVRDVYAPGSTFEIGKGNVVKEGKDVLIITAGQILSDALDAAEELEKEGISCEVIDMFTIKPLDEELILQEAAGKKAVVTFENHSTTGGLGSAVAETLMENGVRVPFRRHGVTEQFGQVGSQEWLQQEFRLTAKDLEDTVRDVLKKVE